MPGPKYNYLNVRDDLRIAPCYTGQISFGDVDMHISSASDGTLSIGADTSVSFTGPVNLGTSALTIGGNATIATTKYFTYSNDSSSASGLVGTRVWSGSTFAGSGTAGWIKVVIGSATGYIPVLSGSLVKS